MWAFYTFATFIIMIAQLKGQFEHKTPASLIVDVQGVGYEVHISLHTYTTIANENSGQLFTYLHVTENNYTIFGFATKDEKELFLQLISVSGVGASMARMMLSGMKPEEIKKAIVTGNVTVLCSIKGIGKKTAERLIVELKEKLAKQSSASTDIDSTTISSGSFMQNDAVNALVALGIARNLAEQAVIKVITINPNIALQDLIKLALKNI